MKKMNLLALCVLSLLAVSCQEDELVSHHNGLVTVGATMEEETIFPSRSNVTDEGIFTWFTGDQIGLWGTKGSDSKFYLFDLIEGSGNQNGLFNGEISGNVTFSGYAVYPYSTAHKLESGTLKLNLPDEYGSIKEGYIPNTNALMISNLGTEASFNNDLQFSHVGGVVCVTFENYLPEGTCGVRLLANQQITGNFAVTDGSITAGTLTTGKENDEVTIYFEPLTAQQTGVEKYYFPVPTGTDYQFGLSYLKASDSGTPTVVEVHPIVETSEKHKIARTDLLMLDKDCKLTIGGNTENSSTENVTSDDEMAEALAKAVPGSPLNISASSQVKKLAMPQGNGYNIHIAYDKAPESLNIAETLLSKTAESSSGKINITIPAKEGGTTLNSLSIEIPGWEVSINEGMKDAITVTTFTYTAAASLVMGQNVSAYTVTDKNNVKTYTVYTAAGLQEVGKLIDADETSREANSSIVLANDIDMTDAPLLYDGGKSNWKPIGRYGAEFIGNVDGQNHSIKGIVIKNLTNGGRCGFIGDLKEGTIKNLKLIDCTIEDSGHQMGFIAGGCGGSITDCTVGGNSTINSVDSERVGGIVGYPYSTCVVSGCKIIDNVSITVASCGGIIGSSAQSRKSEIYDCHVGNETSNISITTKKSGAGGIANGNGPTIGLGSKIVNCSVENCTIIAENSGAGGFVYTNKGMIIGSTVKNCTIKGKLRSGGFAGESSEPIIACYAENVNVTLTGAAGEVDINAYGGIVGANAAHGNGSLIACYAYNCTTGTSKDALTDAHNIVGTNLYATFDSVKYPSGNNGKIGTVTDCFYFAHGATGTDVVPLKNCTGDPINIEGAKGWSEAASTMNTAINTWNGTNDPTTSGVEDCEYRWGGDSPDKATLAIPN